MNAPRPRTLGLGSLGLVLAEGMALPVGLLVAGLLTRQISPADYGVYTLATTVIALSEWGILAFFARAIIALTSEAPRWRPVAVTAIRLNAAAALLLAAALWLGQNALATALREPRLPAALGIFLLDIPLFVAGQAFGSVLVARGRPVARAGCILLRHAVRAGLALALVLTWRSAAGALAATAVASGAELAAGAVLVGIRPWARSDFPARRLLRLALPLAFAAFALRLVERLDVFALKAWGASTAAVGGYVAAQSLAMAVPMAVLPVLGVLLAHVRQAARAGDADALRAPVGQMLGLLPRLLPFLAIGVGAAPRLLALVYGDAYADAAACFVVLLGAGLAQAAFGVATTLLVGLGRNGALVRASVAMLVLAALAHASLTRAWLGVGAAAATAVAIGATGIFCLAKACRAVDIRVDAGAWARCAVMALIVGGLARAAPGGPILAAFCAGLAVLAGLGLVASGEVTAAERAQAAALVRGLLGRWRPPR